MEYVIKLLMLIPNLLKMLVSQSKGRREALQKRFDLIYAPLRSLLIETHITSARAMYYPKLSQRIERSYYELKSRRWRTRRIKNACKYLFDKHGNEWTRCVEYGQDIPIKEIREIYKANAQYADPKLADLLQRVDRSKYERYDLNQEEMTPEEYELVEHIHKEYRRLNRILLPK